MTGPTCPSEPAALAAGARELAAMASRQGGADSCQCAHCGTAVATVLRCSRCKGPTYCCKDHQVNGTE